MEHQSIFLDPHLWYDVAFVLFFVLAGKALWKAITAWLDGKIGTIQSSINEAAVLRAEAEQLLLQAKKRHEEASAEAERLIKDASENAAHLKADAEAETQKMIARRETQVTERIAQAEKQALADIQTQTVHMALTMAQEKLTALPQGERDALTNAAIKDIKAA